MSRWIARDARRPSFAGTCQGWAARIGHAACHKKDRTSRPMGIWIAAALARSLDRICPMILNGSAPGRSHLKAVRRHFRQDQAHKRTNQLKAILFEDRHAAPVMQGRMRLGAQWING